MNLLKWSVISNWGLILFGLLFLSCSEFAADERQSVQLVLKKKAKTYLFSNLGTFITQNKIDKNEHPSITNSIRIVSKDQKLYTEPQYIKSIANLIVGNYVIHDFSSTSMNGYVTEGKREVYDKKYVDEPTDAIAVMNSIANIHLTDIAKTKDYHISWQRSPELRPLKNCVKMALWVDKSYKPGERTAAKEHLILIDLNDLVQSFDKSVTLNYVEEEGVLYFIVDQ